MDQSDPRGQTFIAEFGEVAGQLSGRQHPLVGDRRRGQRGEVDALGVEALAHDIGAPAQVLSVSGRVIGVEVEEHLSHPRLRRSRDLAEYALIMGHIADGEHAQPLFGGDASHGVGFGAAGARLGQSAGGLGVNGGLGADEVLTVVLGEEADADGVFARGGKIDALIGQHLREVVVRDLECDARSVAGALVRADAAAVFELAQRSQGLVDDLVVGRPAVADDEREPAGVVLESRVVEADTAWRCRSFLGRRSLLSHAMPSRSRVRSEKTTLSETAVLCPQGDRPRTRWCDVVLTVGSTTYTQLRTLRNSRKDRSPDQKVSVDGPTGSGGSRIPW